MSSRLMTLMHSGLIRVSLVTDYMSTHKYDTGLLS